MSRGWEEKFKLFYSTKNGLGKNVLVSSIFGGSTIEQFPCDPTELYMPVNRAEHYKISDNEYLC